AAIEAEMVVVARSGRAAVLHLEAAVAVAGHRAEAPGVEHRRIGTGEKAAGRTVQARGIAVAARVIPGAETLAPEREAVRARRRRARPAVVIGGDDAGRSARGIEGRPQAVVDGTAQEAAVLDPRGLG